MPEAKYPTTEECKYRHGTLWKMVSFLMTLMVLGLTAVGYTYVHNSVRAARAEDNAVKACRMSQEAASEACDEAKTAMHEVQLHAAESTVDRAHMKQRLDEMGVRQTDINRKTDHILEVVIELKQNGHGGE